MGEAALGPNRGVGSMILVADRPSVPTADDGLNLLRAFRSISCAEARARVLHFVFAESKRTAALRFD